MFVSIMRRSALINLAMCADNMSLSPNVISSVETESFSFIIGIMPRPISLFVRSLNVFSLFLSNRSEYVRRSCDIVMSCSLKPLWYACIRSVWPIDAEHWFVMMSSVFCQCMWRLPSPIAPLETIVNCFPVDFWCLICFARELIRFWFNASSLFIIVFVPIFITILLDSFIFFLCRIAATFCFLVHDSFLQFIILNN